MKSVRYWTQLQQANGWHDWPKYNPQQENVLRLKTPQSHVLPAGRFAKDHHCGFWDQTGVY
jgi:para-nitrobenzyl esterase